MSEAAAPRALRPHVHAGDHQPYEPDQLRRWLAAHGRTHACGAWAAIKLLDTRAESSITAFEDIGGRLQFMAEADAFGFRTLVTVVPSRRADLAPRAAEPEGLLHDLVQWFTERGIRPALWSWGDAGGTELDELELEIRAGRALKAMGQRWLVCDARGPVALLAGLEHRLRTMTERGAIPDAFGFQAGLQSCGWWGTHHWHLMREGLGRRGWKGPVLQTQATFGVKGNLASAHGWVSGTWTRENLLAAEKQNAAALTYALGDFFNPDGAPAGNLIALTEERPRLPVGLHLREVRATSMRLMQAGGASLAEALDRLFPFGGNFQPHSTPRLPQEHEAGAGALEPQHADDDVGMGVD